MKGYLLILLSLVVISGCTLNQNKNEFNCIKMEGNELQKANISFEKIGFTETEDIFFCRFQEIPTTNGTIKYIFLELGPPMDCPSGCIFKPVQILATDNNFTYLNETRLNKARYELLEYLQLNHPFCKIDLLQLINSPQENVSKEIIEIKNDSFWKLNFNNYSEIKSESLCTLNGNLIIREPLNFSSISIETTNPVCNKSEEQYAEQWTDCAIYYNDSSYCKNYRTVCRRDCDKTGAEMCYTYLAWINKDVAICENVYASYYNSYYKDLCIKKAKK